MSYRIFKSGTDVRGMALSEGEAPLNDTVVFRIGLAFAKFIGKDKPRIAIGRDSRVTGEKLLIACAQGMTAAGATVTDFGLCTTPAMFMSTQLEPKFDAAVMVTASHLPSNMNGLKFFLPDGGLNGQDISDILIAASGITEKPSWDLELTEMDFLRVYMDFLQGKMREFTGQDKPLTGMRILVDAGNGAGGFYEETVRSMGADTTGSQFLDPDGTFPNHIPNPENEEAMRSIAEAVVKNKADLGVLFDTDCDRAAMVDKNGQPFADNRLIALASVLMLREHPGSTIVTDSVTSTALREFIETKGGHQRRFRRGYRNVIGEAQRLNAEGVDCPLAMETSGHAALRENYFLDDGAYLVTRLLCEATRLKAEGRDLSDLTRDLREPLETISLRLDITDEDFVATGNAILDNLVDYALLHDDADIIPDNVEGVRVHFNKQVCESNAWLLMNLSLHEPNMPVRIESDFKGGVLEILEELYSFLKDCPGLNITPVREAIESRQ